MILRTAAAPKPLAVLDLSGAAITASSTPLYPEDSPDSAADSSDVLWVLRIQVQQDAARGGSRHSLNNSSKTVKIKIAAQKRELQVSL